MEQDELLLGINEWLDLHGIDRAYRKDMKKTYETLKPDLEAQLAKDEERFAMERAIIEKQERERIKTKIESWIMSMGLGNMADVKYDWQAEWDNFWQALKAKEGDKESQEEFGCH